MRMGRDESRDDVVTDRAKGGPPLRPAVPWLVATLAVGIVAIVVGVVRLDALPDPYPVHFGPAGDPDRFTDRTLPTVLMPVVVGLLCGLAVFATLLLVRAQGQRALVTPLAALGFAVGGGMALMSIGQYLSADATPPAWGFWVLLAAITLPTIWVLVASVRVTRESTDDREGWVIGGLIYANPDDPDVFVPKRAGVGVTINLGRPVGWLVLAAILLPGIIIVVGVTLWA